MVTSRLPRGYLQELDTVRFAVDIAGADRHGRLRDTKARIFLYSVFYDVVLSPNQVLDLLVLRDGLIDLSSTAPLSLPFVFGVDSGIYARLVAGTLTAPFRTQLQLLLARAGENAFIFSSVPGGRVVAKEWGEFVHRAMPDEAVLYEARHHPYYAAVLDWAERLDGCILNLRLTPYTNRARFSELLSDYHRRSGAPPFINDVPGTRSRAYQMLEENVKDEGVRSGARDLIDLISNLQNAIDIEARLILDADSPYISDRVLASPGQPASVDIDFANLFVAFPRLKDAIKGASLEKLSEALYESRTHALNGWRCIDELPVARIHFSSALKTFLTIIFGYEGGVRDVIDNLAMTPALSANASVSALVPVGKFINYCLYKRALKGVGRFLNLRGDGAA
jgi:hypothetical protein